MPCVSKLASTAQQDQEAGTCSCTHAASSLQRTLSWPVQAQAAAEVSWNMPPTIPNPSPASL